MVGFFKNFSLIFRDWLVLKRVLKSLWGAIFNFPTLILSNSQNLLLFWPEAGKREIDIEDMINSFFFFFEPENDKRNEWDR